MKVRQTGGGRPIAVLSQLPPPRHGSTMMTVILLEALAELGLKHRLVERRFSKTLDQVGRFSFKKVISGLGLLGRVLRCHLTDKPSVWVVFITNRPASFLVDWAVVEVLSVLKQPMIHYVHTVGFCDLAARNGVFRTMVRRSLAASSKVVCLGPSLVNDVAWAGLDNIAVIPNTPLHPKPFEHPAPDNGQQLLFLSNLLPEKGAADFIACAIAMCRSGSGASFVVAGASPNQDTYRELSRQIEVSGYGEQIRLVGPADEHEKSKLFSSSTALVFPSRYRFEAQPLTIIEALAAGLPVIAYDTGGIRDLVIPAETGILIPPGCLNSLRQSMERVVEDNGYREILSRGARRHFTENLSREKYQEAWFRLLEGYQTG